MSGTCKLMGIFAGTMLSALAVGCGPQHPNEVPASASMTASGDREVAYTTPSRGMVYIYDKNTHRLVWSGEVDQGKFVKIERPANRITVDGTVVATKIGPAHTEEIYFAPSSSATLVSPAPQAQSSSQAQPASNNLSGNGLVVTPHVSVSPANDQPGQPGSVTLSPGLSVAPSTQPAAATTPQQ